VVVAVAGVALSLVLSACSSGSSSGGGSDNTGSGSSNSGGGTDGGTLKWATTFPTHWDPVVSGAGANFRILALAYASLTNTDTKGNPTPGLAESWKYNATGTEVTFHLRPNLKFSDGTPVNAAAVKDAIVRGQTQQNSAYVQDLDPIKSVTTSGDLDVLVNLKAPNYQIPLLFGERVLQIASPKAAANPTQLDQNPVGAGPFIATQVIPGQKAVFKKNPDYWDAKDIHIANVEVDQAPSASTVVAGLKTGVYNFATLDPSQAAAAKAGGLDVFVQPGYNANDISININKAPFKGNPKLVDAIRYAINRQQFVDQLSFGYGQVTNQPFPPGYVAYDPQSANLYPYDVAKAKQALAAAGYQPGQVKLDLVTSIEDPQAEIIQSQLGAIGIKVTISVDKNWATPYFGKSLVFSIYGTTGRDAPLETLTAHFGPQGVLNLSSPYTPAGFEAAAAKAAATPLDSPDYAKNLQAATRVGLTSQALIFTYVPPNLFAKSKSISALPANPGHIDWTGVTISK
jgi:peptide/nickel transport system substrate-binding protein